MSPIITKEVHTIREWSQENAVQDLGADLMDRGYHHMGGGLYGEAYGHPDTPDRVIKVFQARDSGYSEFLRFLTKRKESNPMFPKIYNIVAYEDQEGRRVAYTVEMERLIKIDMMPNRWGLEDKYVEFLGRAVRRNGRPLREVIKITGWVGHETKAIKALSKVYTRSRRRGMCFEVDLHRANIMFRQNGQAVITDPFCG